MIQPTTPLYLLVLFAGLCFARFAEDRMVGGVPIPIEESPWTVTMGGMGDSYSGVILTSRWILSCGYKEEYTFIYAKNNMMNFGEGEVIFIQKTIRHNKFVPGFWHYGYTMFKLERDIKFDRYAKPIQISNLSKVPIGAKITVVGRGFLVKGNVETQRHEALMSITLHVTKCTRGKSDGSFCSRFENGKSMCSGDSGGAVTIDGKLVGVSNFVTGGCGNATHEYYFSNVLLVKDWIRDIIKKQ